ncbi:MAG: CDP-alcohol phosphatidyltransferase family protein [Patescibacteria group bacterium]
MYIFSKSKGEDGKWKQVRKEKLLKIKRRIEEILDREHSITAKEKSWRDRFFRPLSKLCRDAGIRANYISLIGVILVCIQIWNFWIGEELLGLFFALLAAFTDMIDGPIARFTYTENSDDDITAFGTFLDHFRDYFLALSFGYFSLFYHNIFHPIEITLFVLIALLYIGIFIGTLTKLRRYKEYGNSTETKLRGFLLPEMQTTFWGRAQFFMIIAGITVLFVGRMNQSEFLILFSFILLGIHMGINFRNLLEEYVLG